ncbi:MAG: hypothetical protein ACQGVK_20745 [Myxococcota bacterium]
MRPRPNTRGARADKRRRALDPSRWVPAPALATAGAPDAPPLGFRGDDDERHTWISGSLSIGFHVLLLGAIFVSAWLAPESVLEETIEVTLLEPDPEPVELPGSNDPSGGGPKALAARAPASAAALAASLAAADAQAPEALDELSARALEMADLAAARAPTEIERRALDAGQVEAQAEVAPTPRPLDVATLSPVAVDPSALAAPRLDFSAPRAIDTAAPSAISAPQAFAGYQDVGNTRYDGQASAVGTPLPSARGGSAQAGRVGVDTGVTGALVGGTGAGGGGDGTGTGVPTVECLRSAYVVRYMDEVKNRTYARWKAPPETPEDSVVKLRFKLDVTGSPTAVEFVEAASEELGGTTVQALRAAAPFPAMDARVRCLAERRLTLTFTANPSS